MKLTNRGDLPQPMYDAIKNDPYSKGDADVSVTGLIAPMRQVRLKELFYDQLEEDASDRVYSMLGQLVHLILERADNKSGAMVERRFMIEVDGVKLSGGVDRYSDGVVQDYKFVSLYKFKNGAIPEDYEQQVNCYAELLRQNGFPVNSLKSS